jgi:hypothetical protein
MRPMPSCIYTSTYTIDTIIVTIIHTYTHLYTLIHTYTAYTHIYSYDAYITHKHKHIHLPVRKGGIMVDTVDELVGHLKNTAKVI